MKKIILSIAYILVASSLFAQEEQSQHEMTVNLGGGLSALKYKLESGDNKLGLGGSVGLGYTYFINNQFGITTGVEANYYQSEYSNDKLIGSYTTADPQNASEYFRLNYTYNKPYNETQSALFVQIPLMAQFQTEGYHKFYVAAGGRVGFPVNTKYKTDASDVTISGYYSHEGTTYEGTPNAKIHGFGTYSSPDTDGKLSLKTAFMASIELGMKWALNDNFALYTGVYGDYGLNDIQKTKDKGTVTYHHDNGTASQSTHNYLTFDNSVTSTSTVEKITPMTFGLKLRLSFGLGNTKVTSAKGKGLNASKQQQIQNQAAIAEAYRRAEAARLKEEQEAAQMYVEPDGGSVVPATPVARPSITDKELRILLEPLWGFDITKTILTPEMKQILDRKIPILKKYYYLGIVCEGHTCDAGSDAINEKLGYERAQAVKDYFVKNGLVSTRFSTVSKGKYYPVVKNDTEDHRKRNRRVDFVIKK